ncbi:hypothetical protein Vadar_032972 [Vaccinium darrowii]|uniref:Uncharacterized protein n=1 Tax=Vaccinium darrowii TaxID=229202 RepID=A0ACB7XMC5_9ERIC|nr:hypothetical protein Vadar_032972 [Vaccinium darrowii]
MSNGDPEFCSLAVDFFPMQRTTGWQPLMPTAVLPFRTALRAYSPSGDKTVMALMCIVRKKIVGVALEKKETTGEASVATQMEARERERSGALQLRKGEEICSPRLLADVRTFLTDKKGWWTSDLTKCEGVDARRFEKD